MKCRPCEDLWVIFMWTVNKVSKYKSSIAQGLLLHFIKNRSITSGIRRRDKRENKSSKGCNNKRPVQ